MASAFNLGRIASHSASSSIHYLSIIVPSPLPNNRADNMRQKTTSEEKQRISQAYHWTLPKVPHLLFPVIHPQFRVNRIKEQAMLCAENDSGDREDYTRIPACLSRPVPSFYTGPRETSDGRCKYHGGLEDSQEIRLK
jgi:hypothetical protein